MITQKAYDSVLRKNGRARKRMARRLMRKAFKENCRILGVRAAQTKPYTPLELGLNSIADTWPEKRKRSHAKRLKDIDKSIDVRLRHHLPGQRLF